LYDQPLARHISGIPYDRELSECFSKRDLVFAADPTHREHAFQWLIPLREHKATWIDAWQQIEEFLRERGVAVCHILDQIESASVLLKPWLSGPINDEEMAPVRSRFGLYQRRKPFRMTLEIGRRQHTAQFAE